MRSLKGLVVSGYGVASGVLKGFHGNIERHCGMTLVPGTLNVDLREPVSISADFTLNSTECNDLENYIKFQSCNISGFKALIMRTSTQERGESHPLSYVEIMSADHLRTALGLADGAPVTIEAEF